MTAEVRVRLGDLDQHGVQAPAPGQVESGVSSVLPCYSDPHRDLLRSAEVQSVGAATYLVHQGTAVARVDELTDSLQQHWLAVGTGDRMRRHLSALPWLIVYVALCGIAIWLLTIGWLHVYP
ncbi:hypothetical protein [Nocardia sp. XZ_19_369]|uniref:hypothetical protein n=1 Tax=Nocardia sp. XZ_19_369 TaxID=2769487 RepID=UPI00188ED5D3|nr:hypothetical protein [Nocardia sp. XZ_19_369]